MCVCVCVCACARRVHEKQQFVNLGKNLLQLFFNLCESLTSLTIISEGKKPTVIKNKTKHCFKHYGGREAQTHIPGCHPVFQINLGFVMAKQCY